MQQMLRKRTENFITYRQGEQGVGDGYPTHKQAFPLFQDCSKGMAQKHF
jgi:hypothetical protein